MQTKKQDAIYKAIMEKVNTPDYFAARNDIFITEVGMGFAKGRMNDTGKTKNHHGTHHGGAIATMMDTLCGTALFGLGKNRVTVHASIEYLRMAKGTIYGEATVRKEGQSICVCQVSLWDETEKEVAIGTFSFCIIGDFNPEDILKESEQT